jgi:hypothetical protein
MKMTEKEGTAKLLEMVKKGSVAVKFDAEGTSNELIIENVDDYKRLMALIVEKGTGVVFYSFDNYIVRKICPELLIEVWQDSLMEIGFCIRKDMLRISYDEDFYHELKENEGKVIYILKEDPKFWENNNKFFYIKGY